MQETQHYHLYLEDGDSEKFITWRKRMNGSGESNMQKLDEILFEKAGHSKSVSTVLKAVAWEGVDAPYVQTIMVDGLGKYQNGTISVAQNTSIEQRDAARNALLSVTGQAEGTLVISADGEVPEVDIPVVVIFID